MPDSAIGKRPLPSKDDIVSDTVDSIAARFNLRYREQKWLDATTQLLADDPVGGAGFSKSVVDIGAQRVQRQTSLQIPLRTRDFISVQPAAHPDLDAFAAEAQRRVHSFAHGPAEAHAFFQLQRNRFRHQLCI